MDFYEADRKIPRATKLSIEELDILLQEREEQKEEASGGGERETLFDKFKGAFQDEETVKSEESQEEKDPRKTSKLKKRQQPPQADLQVVDLNINVADLWQKGST